MYTIYDIHIRISYVEFSSYGQMRHLLYKMSSTDPHLINTTHHMSHKRGDTQQTSTTNDKCHTVYTHMYIMHFSCVHTRGIGRDWTMHYTIGVRAHLLSEWSGTVFVSLMHAFLQEHDPAKLF